MFHGETFSCSGSDIFIVDNVLDISRLEAWHFAIVDSLSNKRVTLNF